MNTSCLLRGFLLVLFLWFGMDAAFAQFVLRVEISDNTGASRTVEFGFDDAATNEYDSGLDQLAPPPAPFGVFDVRLIGGPFDLYRDVRAYSENETSWSLQINPTNGSSIVFLNWEYDFYVSRGARVTVGAETVHMREQQSVEFAASSQVVTFTFEPPLQKESTLQGTEGFRLFSAPYKWMHIRDVTRGLWTQGFPNAITSAGDPNVFYWDEAGFFTPANDGFSEIEPGKGISVFVYDDDDYDGTPDGFPKVVVHEGYQRTDDVHVPVRWSGSDANQGWNLIGNPYELPLDLSKLQTVVDYSNLASYFYIWVPEANDNNGAYQLFVQGGAFIPGISFDGIIQPSQAFWARTTGANPELILKRTHLESIRGEKQLSTTNVLTFGLTAQGFTGRTAIILTDEENQPNIPFLSPLRSQWLELATLDSEGYSTIRYENSIDSEEIIIPMDILTNLSGTATLSFELPEQIQTQADFILCDVYQNHCFELVDSGSIEIELGDDSLLNEKQELGTYQPSPPVLTHKNGPRFEVIIQPKSTSVDVNPDLPESIVLSQNYPNPFNPRTVIEYAIPFESLVLLEVYSLQGQKVAELVNQNQSAGNHSILFDASHLSSGVYLYRLQSGNHSITKKLLLVK